MALVNVHPDYMQFPGQEGSPRSYPAELYFRLLEYARTRYNGLFWQPLPSEVAEFIVRLKIPAPRKPKRICMVTHSFYMSDARVTRYAEALAERGDHVDVLALQNAPEAPREEQVRGVNIIRLQRRFGKNQSSRLSYLFPVLRFLVASSFWLARRHTRARYDLIHIHNVPDFLILAGLYPKLTGSKVILDIHDIVPEFYASKFGVHKHTNIIRLLRWTEKLSARLANHIIISNHLWRDTYAARTGSDGKCSVFINNVDSTVFRRRPRTRQDDRVILIFPGGLQWHQGLDIALRAFQKVRARLPKAEFHIYGDGNMKDQLVALAADLGLNGSVRFLNPLPVRDIAEVMANADLGVVPKRADSFGNEAYSTKIMEFMALGVPVVVSKTKIDQHYFNDSVVRFFESGDPEALARAIVDVLGNQGAAQAMVERAAAYAEQNSWQRRKGDYLQTVDALTARL
jgi:glycosyltransferase involved in cell wall biosynthesis